MLAQPGQFLPAALFERVVLALPAVLRELVIGIGGSPAPSESVGDYAGTRAPANSGTKS